MAIAVRGVDVARYQGEPDWSAVRTAGFTFACIKATEGVGYVSPVLDGQLAGARRAGMATGLYHYARPDTNTPQQEAAHFAAQLARLGAGTVGNLPPCLDIEVDAVDLAGWVKGFLAALRGHTGRDEVMIYASTSWFLDKLEADSWIDPEVFLWVAHHGREPGLPGYRTDRVALHQHTSDGRVPGIEGAVDLNVALVDLTVLTGGDEVSPKPPAPPGETYVVQPGDTLSGLGVRSGVAWRAIARANGITDPDLIYVGQVLRIPR